MSKIERRARGPDPPRCLRGFLHPACGPVLRVAVRSLDGRSARGLAVLDTGASLSAIDRDVARHLQLPSPRAAHWSAISDQGTDAIAPVRRAAVGLGDDPRLWELDLLEIPRLAHAVPGSPVVVLLGWNFLDQCTLTLDGPARMFRLALPPIPAVATRTR